MVSLFNKIRVKRLRFWFFSKKINNNKNHPSARDGRGFVDPDGWLLGGTDLPDQNAEFHVRHAAAARFRRDFHLAQAPIRPTDSRHDFRGAFPSEFGNFDFLSEILEICNFLKDFSTKNSFLQGINQTQPFEKIKIDSFLIYLAVCRQSIPQIISISRSLWSFPRFSPRIVTIVPGFPEVYKSLEK